jgi:hypothetical protein
VLSDGAGTLRQTHNSSGAVAFDTAGTVFGTSGQVLTSGGSGAVPTWTTVGTMSTQNANAVAITGGAIDGTTVGSTTAAAGSFTTLAASGVTVIGTSTGAVNGSLQLRRSITGGTTAYVAGISTTVQTDVTGQASGFSSFINTVASSFTLGLLKHYNAQQGTIGATSAVTNQYGFFVDSSLVGATNNYGFYSDIASGTNRFNFAAIGTAANVFVGTTSIGGLVGSESLRVTPVASAVNYLEATGAVTTGSPILSAAGSDTNIGITLTPKGTSAVNLNGRVTTGSSVGAGSSATQITIGGTLVSASNVTRAVSNIGTAPSTSTTEFSSFLSSPSTTAAAYTITTMQHFGAAFSTLGATSAITNQYGFFANSNLTVATNNYGFYGNIASGTGRFNFYANGTAANVFVGTTSIGGAVGSESLRATRVVSAVNYLDVSGAIATASPSLAAAGSDTNIDLTLTPKGTGVLKFGTYTAGILAQAGYITIKDAAGNTRNLLVG